MTCPEANQVQAFYDGELSPSKREAVRQHLEGCAQCRRLLADLERLSSELAVAPLPALPPRAMMRFNGAWHAARDRGIRRVAGWLSFAAAAVLVLSILPFGGTKDSLEPPTVARTGGWELAAVMPPGDRTADVEPTVEVALFLASDLSADRWGTP